MPYRSANWQNGPTQFPFCYCFASKWQNFRRQWISVTSTEFHFTKNNSSNHSRFFFLLWWWDKFYQEWLRMDRSLMSRSLSLSYNTWVVLLNGYSLMGVEFRTKNIQCDPPNLVMWNNSFSLHEQVHPNVHRMVLKFIYSEKVKKYIMKYPSWFESYQVNFKLTGRFQPIFAAYTNA